jgi:hypothetical protein
MKDGKENSKSERKKKNIKKKPDDSFSSGRLRMQTRT